MSFRHWFTWLAACLTVALLTGCAAGGIPVGTRYTTGVIAKEPFTYAIYALDPKQENSMEFSVLRASLTQALDRRGSKAVTQNPSLVFLLGHAIETGVEAPYENYIVLLGFDSTSRAPVYQARVKVETKKARTELVGSRVLEALVADLGRVGASIEPLRLNLGGL